VRPTVTLALVPVLIATSVVACIPPKDQRPGLGLSGEVAATPGDWSFSDAHREIALQVQTPYRLPHSVTIWCASADGELFVAARSPEEKRWPGWVADRPDVRLRIGEQLYEGRLSQLSDEDELARVRAAYSAKYDLPNPPPQGGPPMRYWRVEPRGQPRASRSGPQSGNRTTARRDATHTSARPTA